MDVGSPAQEQARWSAAMGLFGTLWFTLSIIVLSVFRSDVDPHRHYVSELARGPSGEVLALAFVLYGLAVLAFRRALLQVLPEGRGRGQLIRLVLVAGIGMILLAFFPIDRRGAAPTLVGVTHGGLALLVFSALVAAAVIFDRTAPRGITSERAHTVLTFLTGLTVVSYLEFVALTFGHWGGLLDARALIGTMERVMLGAGVAWMSMASVVVYQALGASVDARWATAPATAPQAAQAEPVPFSSS